MAPLPDLPQIIRNLAARSRLVSLQDAAGELEHSPADCERLLDGYVASGVLRKATTRRGQTYYWLSDPGKLTKPEAKG